MSTSSPAWFAFTLMLAIGGCLRCMAGALEVYGVPALEKITEGQMPSADWQHERMNIECARNEAEAFQVVVRSAVAAGEVALVIDDLRSEEGAVLPASSLRLHKVEWVDVNAPFDPAVSSAHPSFQPDPLPLVDAVKDRFTIEPKKNLVFWLTVTTTLDTRSGNYHGRVRVRPLNGPEAVLDLQLRVRAFALPDPPILQSLVGLSASAIYQAHGCTTRADQERIIRAYLDEYIRARLSPFLYAPGTAAFNPLPDAAIRWEFAKDDKGSLTGEARLDFTGFDREASRYLDQRRAFSAFNFAPYLWNRSGDSVELRFTDAKGMAVPQRTADGSINPVFEQLVVSVFRQIAAHLAEKGWLDRAIYYVTDEPRESDVDALKVICQFVRRADSRIRTALTYDPANRPRLAELVEDGRSLISVWIPKCMLYREDIATAQRAKGADYWLYDVKEHCLISQPGLMNRSMFWDVWRRNASGYLYYLSTLWPKNGSPWSRPNSQVPGYEYRHGDGYFFYPPLRKGSPDQPVLDRIVPSVRWELMREGAEDYDWLRMLERLMDTADKRKLAAAAAGRTALAKARDFADHAPGIGASYTSQMLQLEKTAGWSWSTSSESWLTYDGRKPATLKVTLKTELSDGLCDLSLRVFHDPSRRYSHFLINGRAFTSPETEVNGPVVVQAGQVSVRDGSCSFELSSSPENGGVIVFGVGLSPAPGAKATTLYSVRHEVAMAIELLQSALRPAAP